jgi:hypothetical protein
MQIKIDKWSALALTRFVLAFSDDLPGYLARATTLLLVCIVLKAIVENKPAPNRSAHVRLLGDISYPLYLVHIPVFILGAERFDAVLATEVIEHVAHPDEFLRQLAGGVLIVTTPNGAYFRNKLPRFSGSRTPLIRAFSNNHSSSREPTDTSLCCTDARRCGRAQDRGVR